MKKVLLFSMMLALCASCSNQEREFDDFAENVYFPIQYPVRTLVLGESRYDNQIDLDHAFSVGVCVGGMYENKNDITVDFDVDESLIGDLVNVKALPSAYYAIEADGAVTIPKGSFTGTARVNLTDAFFDDPESYTGIYALPLKISSSSRGEILSGTLAAGIEAADANLHVADDWSVRAKDYTLFAVKYINLIDGDFFRRGDLYVDGTFDSSIKNDDIEQNPIINMTTCGRYSVNYSHTFGSTQYPVILTYDFDNAVDGVCDVTFSVPAGSSYSAEASAEAADGANKCYDNTTEFAAKHGAWLTDPNTPNKEFPHTTLAIDYTVKGVDGSDYRMVDTLVFRNNKVVYEEFTPAFEVVDDLATE